MKIRLMNAAVMPRPGSYTMQSLTMGQYREAVQTAYAHAWPQSYIGYDAAAEVIERITGIRPAVTRESTPVEDGDMLLIARLRQRVQSQDPRVKAANGRVETDPDAYEFFLCEYRNG